MTFEDYQRLTKQRRNIADALAMPGIADIEFEPPHMIGILHEHFMRADGVHPIVESITAASGLAFDVIERPRVHNGTRRPCRSRSIGSLGDDVQTGIGTERARRVGARSRIAGIVAGHDPRARDGIFAKFHVNRKRRTPRRSGVNWELQRSFPHGPCEITEKVNAPLCYNPPKPV